MEPLARQTLMFLLFGLKKGYVRPSLAYARLMGASLLPRRVCFLGLLENLGVVAPRHLLSQTFCALAEGFRLGAV